MTKIIFKITLRYLKEINRNFNSALFKSKIKEFYNTDNSDYFIKINILLMRLELYLRLNKQEVKKLKKILYKYLIIIETSIFIEFLKEEKLIFDYYNIITNNRNIYYTQKDAIDTIKDYISDFYPYNYINICVELLKMKNINTIDGEDYNQELDSRKIHENNFKIKKWMDLNDKWTYFFKNKINDYEQNY